MTKRRTLGRQTRAALALAFALAFCAAAARAQQQPKEAPGSVSGRVREGERGAANLTVVVIDTAQRFRPVARARTDSEGRYRVANVPPGRYVVAPVAPAYVLQDVTSFPPGKPLTLSAGESAEDVDFRVERGGVVTGRVTDSDGNPLVAEPVYVAPADPKPNQTQPYRGLSDQRDIATDDRGVYRIYGLKPGRYLVSVGSDTRTMRAPGAKYYRRTFYPSASEESQAKVVEITSGGVAEDVDITLGPPQKTFSVSGHFVMADTGKPVQVSGFGYSMRDPATGQPTGDFASGSADSRGEFRAVGLVPGRYTVFAFQSPSENVDWYSEMTEFEITDADVSNLAVRIRRGATVSGVVTVEGMSDRAAAARLLAGVRVYGLADRREQVGPAGFVRPVTVEPDGSFRMTGIRPGKFRLNINTETKGLAFARVEVGGAEQRDGLEITEGAQVTGVRIVLAYGTGVIRGQVSFPGGGAPPQGTRVVVIARRAGSDSQGTKGGEADTRGRFQIEGLSAGEYEVQARAFGTGPAYQSEPQRVSVGEGGGDLTLSLNLTPIQPQGGRP
jgi:Carboxypeptidase regulatory-like domain